MIDPRQARDPAPTLNEAGLAQGLAHLRRLDADLDRIWRQVGPPPLWRRAAGFATLMHIILEQKISLASARAVFDRLQEAADPLTPEAYLALDDARLLATGMTRSKMSYGRHLATALLNGRLDLAALERLPDADALQTLQAIKGIGPWTASIYLIMVLGRPDVWPAGDRALAVAVGEVKGLAGPPAGGDLAALGRAYAPWRTVATMQYWHYYLETR
jgi:DNA-3-methyladenine glycosylase II